jgi:predicted DNA binding CopG/RHH family protein
VRALTPLTPYSMPERAVAHCSMSISAAGIPARVNMRLPQPLIDAVKARAAERGIPYQHLIGEAIERAVRR